jgi:hypothetical protein
MKRLLHPVLVMLLLLNTACQTAPKPLSELSEAEQIERFKYSPADKPAETGYDWDNIYRDTALVLLAIPVVVIQGLAASGAHFSIGK